MNANKIRIISASIVGIVLLALGFQYWSFSDSHPDRRGSMVINVAPGTAFYDIYDQLQEKGIFVSELNFKVWTRLNNASNKLRKGEYVVEKRWSHSKILNHILYGLPLFHSFTVKEGFNIYDIEKIYMNAFSEINTSNKFQNLVRNPTKIKQMNIPYSDLPQKARSLEGYLFPETYAYQKYDSAETLVQAQLEQFKRRALPILEKHPWAKEPGGIFKLVTLASIVEKESGVFHEQPTIASVFWNRLNKKMRLQSDPTTIYALLPDFDGNIRRVHLRSKNLYNTYKMSGLPSGPIANPGESALRAVVAPAETDLFYFVSKGDGTHVFSKTYAEHKSYVRKYILKK